MDRARARLLRAGLELTASRGLHGFSLTDVALKSGTSRTLVHHHFHSKRAFLDALVTLLLQVEPGARSGDGAAEGTAWLSDRLDRGAADPVVTRARLCVLCSAGSGDPYHEQVRAWWRAERQQIADILGEGVRDGEVRTGADNVFPTAALAALVEGVLLASVAMPTDQHARFRSAVVALVSQALTPQQEPSTPAPELEGSHEDDMKRRVARIKASQAAALKSAALDPKT